VLEHGCSGSWIFKSKPDMKIKFYNINGKVVPSQEARILVNDVGLLRGYGVFDFFPFQEGVIVFEEDYFKRFYSSASKMQLAVPVPKKVLAYRVNELIDTNGFANGYIKLVLTGGYARDGYTPGINNLFILQHPEFNYNPDIYSKGARLILQKYSRQKADVKTLDYSNVLINRNVLEENQALDFLYHNGRRIAETSRANFFIVDSSNCLKTTKDSILGGITRKHVIKLASDHTTILEDEIRLEDIPHATEAFMTSTTKGVMPVTKINHLPIGNGKVGPVSLELKERFYTYVSRYIKSKKIS
jgi:branched-subunit amino acid aminotransferase/4-amino-4-deoxychorismate lyase